MGTSLTGNNISASYLGLLKSTDSQAIGSTVKRITDGGGNDLPLDISTSTVRFRSGTIMAPGLSIGSNSEGFYVPSDENIGFVIAGSEKIRLNSDGLSVLNSKLTLNNDQKVRWTSDDVYIQGTTASDNIQLGVGGSTQFTFAQTTGMRLHQYGSGNITGTVTQRLGVTSAGQVVEIPIGGGAVDGSGTAGKIVKWSDTDTITDSVISESSGNIQIQGLLGVGLVPDSAVQLSVNGQIGTSNNGNAGAPDFTFYGDDNTGMFRAGADTLAFSTAGSERARLDSNGRLGLGQTSMTYALEVINSTYDNIAWGGSSAVGVLTQQGSNPAFRTVGDLDIVFYANNNLQLTIDDGSATFAGTVKLADSKSFIIGTGDDFTINHDGASTGLVNNTGHLYISNYAADKDTVFQNDNGSGGVAEYFRLDGGTETVEFAKNATFAGNVTINTTGQGLKVSTAAGQSHLQFTDSTNSKNSFINYDNDVLKYFSNGPSEQFSISSTGATFAGGITVAGNDAQFNHNIVLEGSVFHKDDTNTSFGFPADDTISFSTAGSERARLDSSGRLGLGVTSMTRGLEVSGAGALGTILATDGTVETVLWGDASGTNIGGVGTNNNYGFNIYQNGGVAIEIDTSKNATFAGNVTINKTANPTSLQIGSSLADDPFLVFQSDGNTMAMGIDRSDSNKFVISDNATLGTNNRLTIDTSGNATFAGSVDVGTFTLAGSGIVADAAMTLQIGGGSVNALTLADSTGNATFAGTIDSKAITALAKGGQFGSTGYYVNSTFKDVADNCGVILGHNDTNNGIGVIAGINQLAFLTYGSAWTQALLLDGSQNATFAGDVTANGDGSFGTSGATNNSSVKTLDGSIITKIQSQTAGDTAGILGTESNNVLRLVTNNSTAITIDTSQNVGLGTTSPNARLEISDSTNDNLRIGTRGGNINIFSVNDAGATAPLRLEASQFDFINGNATFAGAITTTGTLTVNSGHINLDAGLSISWDNTHERIEQSDSNLEFFTNNSQSMTLSSSNLGIGTTSPSQKLDVAGNIAIHNSTNAPFIDFVESGATSDSKARITMDQADTNNGTLIFSTEGSGTLSERLRISSTGNIQVSSHSGSNIGYGLQISPQGGYAQIYMEADSADTRTIQRFYNPNGNVGNISISGSATTYATSSDYRLKENVVELTGALDRISQLKPSRFNFKADAETTVDGFLAHEVQEIVPEAIVGEKDAVDEEGNAMYQGIDQSKLVPLLVASIQELKAEIDELKKNK